ncbi:hypothetical protein HNO89_003502 [Sporosarcina luteola]|nr:hypothetical protein [Sporosarcina luteola]
MRREYIITIIVILSVIYYVSGYRLTPLAAAHSNDKELKSAKLIDVFEDPNGKYYLFQNNKKEEYRTVRVARRLFGYTSNASTWVATSQDKVQTIGGMSFKDDKWQGTLFIVKNDDTDVDSIQIETDNEIVQKKVTQGDIVHFQLPYAKQIDHLNAKALNDKGEEIYYYGYESSYELNEIKWRPVR